MNVVRNPEPPIYWNSKYREEESELPEGPTKISEDVILIQFAYKNEDSGAILEYAYCGFDGPEYPSSKKRRPLWLPQGRFCSGYFLHADWGGNYGIENHSGQVLPRPFTVVLSCKEATWFEYEEALSGVGSAAEASLGALTCPTVSPIQIGPLSKKNPNWPGYSEWPWIPNKTAVDKWMTEYYQQGNFGPTIM